jgi:N6-L-threonylcarbamoyladenine synthase
VLSNVTATQEVHQQYGGVIPELASRKHQENIIPVVDAALRDASIHKSELDAIAFTQGPGLLGSLLVGCSFAKTLAMSLNLPLIAVNHMEAHILAHFIEEPRPAFPFLCLTVSGGHTQIVRVNAPLDMIVLGTTRDDAAGEAFDKIGKYLGLDYPAGPIIDNLAQQGKPLFHFPKPKIEGLGFSFSGLKTSVLYFLKDQIKLDPNFIENNRIDICASVQKVIIEILMEKLIDAAAQEHITDIAIAGGVSANSELRKAINTIANEKQWNVYIPQLQYCTDNAAMIAMTAHFKYVEGDFAELDITPSPRMSIES